MAEQHTHPRSGGKGGSKGMATLKRKIPADITPEQDEFIRKTAVNKHHPVNNLPQSKPPSHMMVNVTY